MVKGCEPLHSATQCTKQPKNQGEKEVTKTLTQDVFKGAPEWANFLVVNAYGIGFFTDVSPYLATWRAPNGWVQSSFSKGLIAFAGKFDVDDWQKFKLKRLIGSEYDTKNQ